MYVYYAATKCKVTELGESETTLKEGRGLFKALSQLFSGDTMERYNTVYT
jgi:hypothetical protein